MKISDEDNEGGGVVMVDAHGASTHNANVMLSGQKLKMVREAKNVSYGDMAEALGCSVEELEKIEKSFLRCERILK